MVEFQVRAARMEDVAAVMALDRATELLPHWTEAQYKAVVAQKDGSIARSLFVAEDATGIEGFAVGMVAIAGDEAISELESVAVADAARRRGVAMALCEAVIEWAASRGAQQMELEVRSGSAGAIRLYERLGFVAVGRRTRYYTMPEDDALLMRTVSPMHGAADKTA